MLCSSDGVQGYLTDTAFCWTLNWLSDLHLSRMKTAQVQSNMWIVLNVRFKGFKGIVQLKIRFLSFTPVNELKAAL